jgi:hypothetical protein
LETGGISTSDKRRTSNSEKWFLVRGFCIRAVYSNNLKSVNAEFERIDLILYSNRNSSRDDVSLDFESSAREEPRQRWGKEGFFINQ